MSRDGRKVDDTTDPEEDELEGDEFDPKEYDTLMQLERLESLEEEMMEMRVTTLEEVRERIGELHRVLDAEQH